MSLHKQLPALALLVLAGYICPAQTILKGKIIDQTTKEPVAGATIQCSDAGCVCGCTTNASGEFEMQCRNCRRMQVSSVGYASQLFGMSDKPVTVSLLP